MNKIHLYYKPQPQTDRFLPGDRYIIPALRNLIKGKRISGIEKVFINLCMGFDELKVDYDVNLPFKKIQPNQPVVVLGNGRCSLQGYTQLNPIIAGIGLMTHPSEWPTLCRDYPVIKYLQHSAWANNVYIPYYGADVCQQWPAGIQTDKWTPVSDGAKTVDFLIYNKIMWEHDSHNHQLREPIIAKLQQGGFTYRELVYGQYKEGDFHQLLKNCRALIYLCEHESQGLACGEAMSMNVPVLAWDQGYCQDPNRFKWNDPVIPTTSVPFFDERCGATFKDFAAFEEQFTPFWEKVCSNAFSPREYILENLTLKKSAQKMLDIIKSVYP